MGKNVKEINRKWGNDFINTFNMQEAAIVFAIALTKDNKVRMCCTSDMPPERLKEVLQGIIDNAFTPPASTFLP